MNMAEKGQYQDKAQQVINNYNKAEISDINLLAKKLFSAKPLDTCLRRCDE